MGNLLIDSDEGVHGAGPEANWNESRYLDFWDAGQRIGGWMRIGNRPNAGYAEMSACIHLPDGRVGFMFDKPTISANTLSAGHQSWEIVQPWVENRVRYRGDLMLLDDPWRLTEPKSAFAAAARVPADIDLKCVSTGLHHVMGFDQDHIDLIFLPGQAHFHYQHLGRTSGTVSVGDRQWTVDGFGGKDHSWGPRNWLAKVYFRWLICGVDADNGFMLTRAVGPDKKTRSGFLVENGIFHIVDDFEMKNVYGEGPEFKLEQVELTISASGRQWKARGKPQSWLPLRHRQHNPSGDDTILRIVKSPTDWTLEGRTGEGMCEYHDRIVDGQPAGLED